MKKTKKTAAKKQTKKKASNTKKAAAKKQSVEKQSAAQTEKFKLPPLPGKKRFLHVGCGDKEKASPIHEFFKTPSWQEVRLDIDPSLKPDIVADMRDMHMIEDESFEGVYSSHNLEHLYFHEVFEALKEFHRVLRWGGAILVAMPDLQSVAESIVEKGLESELYKSPTGTITALDMMYGHHRSLRKGYHYMAHKTGFTARTLAAKLTHVGFVDIRVKRSMYNLQAVAFKRKEKTESNQKVQYIETDINEIMKERDEIDQAPNLKVNYSPD